MAITSSTFVRRTANAISVLIVSDAGGGVDTITSALLRGSGVTQQPAGAMKELLETDFTGATQATARKHMLGIGAAQEDMSDVPHILASITQRDSTTTAGQVQPLVDADLDAVTATKFEYNVTLPAATGAVQSYLLNLEFQYSATR